MHRALGGLGHIVVLTLRTLGAVLGSLGSGGVVPPQRPVPPARKQRDEYRP